MAVLYDKQRGFLLWNNARWGGYAFPMKQMGEGDDPVQTALQAVNDRDFPLELPNASGDFIERIAADDRSLGTKQKTYYHYYLVEIDPGTEVKPQSLGPDLKFMDYEEITSAINVTWSTETIVESLKRQEVAVALMFRHVQDELEFLLVRKPRGYFFPAVRRRGESSAEEMAVEAVRVDTGYPGPVNAEFKREATLVHESTRFGLTERRYIYYLCKTDAQIDNGTWFTVDDIKNRPDVSPDAKALLPTAIEIVRENG